MILSRNTFSFPPMKMVLHRSRILSGAPFMTSRWRGSLGSSLSWIDTWYLLVELKGISQAFLLRFLIESTSPRANSMHFSRAASDASPATSFFRIGTPSWPPLNSARLHSVAILARALNPGLVRSEDEKRKENRNYYILSLTRIYYYFLVTVKIYLNTGTAWSKYPTSLTVIYGHRRMYL